METITSTRSPGNTSPEIPEAALTLTETARMPGESTAARKPRSPALTTRLAVIGSPATIPLRTTAPVKPSIPSLLLRTKESSSPSAGQARHCRCSGLTKVPAGRSCLATRIWLACSRGASTGRCARSRVRWLAIHPWTMNAVRPAVASAATARSRVRGLKVMTLVRSADRDLAGDEHAAGGDGYPVRHAAPV